MIDNPLCLQVLIIVFVDASFDLNQYIDERFKCFTDWNRDIIPKLRLNFFDKFVYGGERSIWSLGQSRVQLQCFVCLLDGNLSFGINLLQILLR